MDLYRSSEVLLRSPLLSFLAPTATYRLQVPRASRALAAPSSKRCKSSQKLPRAARSFATSHARREQNTNQNQNDPFAADFPSTPPASQGSVTSELSSMLDRALDLNKNVPTAPTPRTSRFASSEAQNRYTPTSREQMNEIPPARPSSGNRADTIIDGLGLGRNSPPNLGPPPGRISQAVDPLGFLRDQAKRGPPVLDERPMMKLGPRVGRTVEVNNARNMDVGKAFRTLEMQCARNSVRRDFNKQRFHERPGLKRKRLKSERWRRNFKAQFQATVRMVQHMRRQGW